MNTSREKEVATEILTYNKLMEKQDELWGNDGEDLEIMKGLHKLLIAEAKLKGFKGFAVTDDFGTGIFTNLYDSEGNYNETDLTERDIENYGTCQTLKYSLEKIISRERNIKVNVEDICILNREQADYLVCNYMESDQEALLIGKYIQLDGDSVIAFDNRTGNCWVEEFETVLRALLWLDVVEGEVLGLKEVLSDEELKIVCEEIAELEYDLILEEGWLTNTNTLDKKKEAIFYRDLSKDMKKRYAEIVSRKFAENIIENGTMEVLNDYEIENIPF